VNLLLDTHIFLWLISGDKRLVEPLRSEIAQPSNQVFLSVVSIWEAAIKYQIGKLPLPEKPGVYLPRQRDRHLVSSLPLDERSVSRLDTLPVHHRDPFDRMLVCQAIEHNLTVATVDSLILQCGVPAVGEG